MTTYSAAALRAAHVFSAHHRSLLAESEIAACFYCQASFSPCDIREWTLEPKEDWKPVTALCPRCGVDAVLPDAAGLPLTRDFLEQMHLHWFERSATDR